MSAVEPWTEIAPGLWLGTSRYAPTRDRFDVVLTLVTDARPVDDLIRHRVWLISDGNSNERGYDDAVRWASDHWLSGKTVLIRSLHGLHRGARVVASVLIDAGATQSEAVDLIRARRSPTFRTLENA